MSKFDEKILMKTDQQYLEDVERYQSYLYKYQQRRFKRPIGSAMSFEEMFGYEPKRPKKAL